MSVTRAVLLDVFGTLLTLDSPSPRLCELLRERLGIEVTRAQAATALSAEISYYRAHMAQGADAGRVGELHRRCAEVLRDALPASAALAGASTDTMVELLLGSLRFRAYPEVPGTLARLRAGGLRLVAVSNWDWTVDAVLDGAGLLEALDGVVSSAVIGAAKPDPRPLLAGLELTGVRAAEVIHVGDSLDEDVAGAIAAGIAPVLLVRDPVARQASVKPAVAELARERYPQVPQIGSLGELIGLLEL